MRGELFQVHGSEGRSVVDVYPELRHLFLRVNALRKLDDGANNDSFVDAPTILLHVIPESPCIGLALAFQNPQGTSLISLRLHSDLLLCSRTDGYTRV